jgi:formylglycine-generating enzyme required for sulfatase activity
VPANAVTGDATPNGILHLADNVAEWTSSIPMTYPYNLDDPAVTWNDQTNPAPSNIIVRGGSIAWGPDNAAPWYRVEATFQYPRAFIGFRCVQPIGHP